MIEQNLSLRPESQGVIIIIVQSHEKCSSGIQMRDYINSLPRDTIVLVAIKDSVENYGSAATNALRSIGAKDPVLPVALRAPWCLIGYKGRHQPRIKQDHKTSNTQGDATVTANIPVLTTGKTVYIYD